MFGTFGTQPAAPGTTQAPAGGGGGTFGFPSTNTSTNTTTNATGAWGAKPTTSWGGGIAAQPTTATTGSWGMQQQQQQQQQQQFGQPQQQFGQTQQQQQPMTTGGWGAPQAQQMPLQTQMGMGVQPPMQQQQQPHYVALQDFSRQSALASFLMELDKAYDALGPKCRFRTFVYNSCPPGQVNDAVQRERFVAFLNGGGVPEEDWMRALQNNPEPGRMYPQPLHFAQELQQRCDKQKGELKRLTDLVDGYLQDVETVAMLDEANKSRLNVLRQEDVMLRRRWYLLEQKLEVLSRWGQRSGEESLLLRQVEQLRQTLAAPGMFRDALQSMQPLLDSEAELCAEQQSHIANANRKSHGSGPSGKHGDGAGIGWAGGGGLLGSHVDARVVEGWVEFAKQMQDGIQSLHDLLDRDAKDMVAIRERVAQ